MTATPEVIMLQYALQSHQLYAHLRNMDRKPRVHPNGFIQFDVIPGALRLNIWPDQPIPGHPGRIHPIHNHSFDLHSVVLVGALTNVTYSLRQERWITPTYVLHEARRISEHDSILVPTSERGDMATGYTRTF